MKKSKFTPNQIVGILKEYESGKAAEELSRAHGISKAALYSWRKKYGGMEATDLQRLKALEEENHKLEPMYAELALDYQMEKDIIEKNAKALPEKTDRRGVAVFRYQQGVPCFKH